MDKDERSMIDALIFENYSYYSDTQIEEAKSIIEKKYSKLPNKIKENLENFDFKDPFVDEYLLNMRRTSRKTINKVKRRNILGVIDEYSVLVLAPLAMVLYASSKTLGYNLKLYLVAGSIIIVFIILKLLFERYLDKREYSINDISIVANGKNYYVYNKNMSLLARIHDITLMRFI